MNWRHYNSLVADYYSRRNLSYTLAQEKRVPSATIEANWKAAFGHLDLISQAVMVILPFNFEDECRKNLAISKDGFPQEIEDAIF